MNPPLDVLATMANPAGHRNGGLWTTGQVASWTRLRGDKRATTPRVLRALRLQEKAGRVECLGPRHLLNPGVWVGNDVATREELVWRLPVAGGAA